MTARDKILIYADCRGRYFRLRSGRLSCAVTTRWAGWQERHRSSQSGRDVWCWLPASRAAARAKTGNVMKYSAMSPAGCGRRQIIRRAERAPTGAAAWNYRAAAAPRRGWPARRARSSPTIKVVRSIPASSFENSALSIEAWAWPARQPGVRAGGMVVLGGPLAADQSSNIGPRFSMTTASSAPCMSNECSGSLQRGRTLAAVTVVVSQRRPHQNVHD